MKRQILNNKKYDLNKEDFFASYYTIITRAGIDKIGLRSRLLLFMM